MANGQNELRAVNWNELFGFAHIFRSFRMAIHLSKLTLALAAIVLVVVAGWVLDWVWSFGDAGYVQRDAIAAHFYLSDKQFADTRAAWERSRPERAADEWEKAILQKGNLSVYMGRMGISVTGELYGAFSRLVGEENERQPAPEPPKKESLLADAQKDWPMALDKAEEQFQEEVDRVERLLNQAKKQAKNAVNAISGEEKREKAEAQLDRDLRRAWEALTARKRDFYRTLEDIRGRGVFCTLVDHESRCFTNATLGLCRGDIAGGLAEYQTTLRGRREGAAARAGGFPEADKGGFVYWLLMACQGLCWLVSQHLVFAILFLLIALAVWSLLGGAIHRIAALQAARGEKISIRQALRFSIGKFLSFFTAPLIPLVVIFLFGLALVLGGLIGNVPWVGPVVIGLLFGVALVVGLIVAFVVVGLGAGLGLMYPTIAVEGSDSFDAISRSFSYVFNKPWRAVLYGAVALLHGSLCYVFVRGFAFIALKSTHFFAKGGIWTGGEALPGAVDKLDVMWPAPTFASLHAPVPLEAAGGGEQIGAYLVAFWVYIIIGLLGAFILSYGSSATTMIYYLLRRKVDATDLDDVYVEEAEEEELPAPVPEEAEAPEAGEEPGADEADSDEPAES